MPIEPIDPDADAVSNLDGSIKLSSIQRLEESQNLQPLMTTQVTPPAAPGPGPGLPAHIGHILSNLYKTLSMHDLGPDSWGWQLVQCLQRAPQPLLYISKLPWPGSLDM